MPLREESAGSVALLESEVDPPTKRQRPETNSPDYVGLLSISPSREDHDWLERCLSHPWVLQRAYDLREGTAMLRARRRTSVVVCEGDLQPGTWKHLVSELTMLSNPPLLIVASNCPDERLWAEALNLGAHDVLAKPYDELELTRSLHSALTRWIDRGKCPEADGAAARRDRATDSAA